jgi:hypothetical protein
MSHDQYVAGEMNVYLHVSPFSLNVADIFRDVSRGEKKAAFSLDEVCHFTVLAMKLSI